MKPFLRVILLSLRYKWTIAASVSSALLVGVLWGTSIGTLYPFVEVIFQGETISSWVDQKTEDSAQHVAQIQEEIQRLQQNANSGPAGQLPELSAKRAELKEAQRKARWYSEYGGRLQQYAPATPYGTLAALMVVLIATTVIKGVLLVINHVLVARIADSTVRDMRRVFFRQALEMDQRRIDRLGTTNLMTQLGHNLNMIGAGLRSVYGQSIREPLKMLACLVGASLVCWRLLILSLLVAPLGVISVHMLSKRMRASAQREIGGMAAIFQTLIETLNAIKIVKLYNRESAERRRFKRNSNSLCALAIRISFYDATIRPVTELVGILTIVIAILAGGYLVLNQQTHILGIRICTQPLTASTLMLFYALLAGISDPARKMGDIYNIVVRASLASKTLFDTFDEKPLVVAPAVRSAVPLHNRSIRLDDVSFGYRPMQPVLRRVSFEVPFGQTVALLGNNGSGKTTLIHLLTRFYDPTKGDIFIDGVNLKQLSPKKLRRQFAFVPQDPLLFQGSIRENIRYGTPGATEEQILAAAHMARVDEFLKDLPHGFDSDVGEQGRLLSGGQRQRVALARALLRDPRILILDEATSQIDRQAEELIHDSLRDFLRNRTTFIITHRLSSVKLADRVIVLQQGRITQDMGAQDYLSKIEREHRLRPTGT